MDPGLIPLEAAFIYAPALSNCNVLKENELSCRGTFSLFTLSNPIKSAITFRIHSTYSVQSAVLSNTPGGKG